MVPFANSLYEWQKMSMVHKVNSQSLACKPLTIDWLTIYSPHLRDEKSNDVSRNFVVNLPERKVGLSINAR
jgi:hypothetical protein